MPLAVTWVALVLSLLSFVIFWILALRRAKETRDENAPGLHSGELEGAAKLAEAIAKVIDSLAKAGPVTSALVASIAFLLIAAYVALHLPETGTKKPAEKEGVKTTPAAVSSLATEKCVLAGFADGNHEIGAGQDSLAAFRQFPQNCLSAFVSHELQDGPVMVFLVGHVDRRELQLDKRRIYGTNFL